MLVFQLASRDALHILRNTRRRERPIPAEPDLNRSQYALDRTRAGNLPSTPVPSAMWIAKVSGAYTLPWWNVGVAAVYRARQGYPFPQSVQTPSRANSAGTVNVLLNPVGDVRYPGLQMIDLGLNKTIRAGRANLVALVDAFNMANVNTVLAQAVVQNAANANAVSQIVDNSAKSGRRR